jgi:hypothetical protein
MKKLLLCAMLVSSAYTGLYAQDLSYGIKGGFNISNFLTNDDSNKDDYDSTGGFNAGIFVEIPLTENFSIQPELSYSAQGTQFIEYITEDMGTDFRKYKLSFNYLNIPILAKYYVIEGLSLQAGPQLGVFLSAKEKVETDFGDGQIGVDRSALAESADFSFNFGLGYEFGDHFLIDARYNMGLTNVLESNDEVEEELRNTVFQFSVGYKF